MKIVFTGAAGFIAGYAIKELLDKGHEIIGIDNYSKYGPVKKSYDNHPRYTFFKGDAKDNLLMKKVLENADILIANAAMIGGISYFHNFAYDLLSENEKISANTFDSAVWAFQKKKLKKIVVISSSAVFESVNKFPIKEEDISSSPLPASTYGMQKLCCEYFAKGAFEQYGLPYTIVRPFNCVGIGEKRALNDKEIFSGNIKLAMSHVVPDLVQKIVKGQNPLRILGDGSQIRHYTYAGDLAVGIRFCVEKKEALNNDFNISTPTSTTVLELAETIWKKIKGKNAPFNYVSEKPFKYDVQKRITSTEKAKKILGYEAKTSLNEMLDEVIPWIVEQIKNNNI